jgi:type I restriction enzyme, S subunit
MGGEWQELPFAEAVDINPKVKLKKGEIYPFVDMKAVDPTRRGVTESEKRVFTSGGAKFEHFDTLFARITPCLENGKIARYVASSDSDCLAFGSTEFIVIRGKAGVTDNNFAYYLTKWQEFREFAILQMTGTSGRQRVPAESLRGFNVPVPDINEQRAIAHILGSLDDKIELNRRMNETLDTMAQALFKSWFVDFDPVIDNALAAGNEIPDDLKARAATRQALGDDRKPLPEEIRQQFPSGFEYSEEMGWIPEGWLVKSFGELIEKTIGGDWGKEEKDIKHSVSATIIRGTDIPHLKAGALSSAPCRWVEPKKLLGRKLADGDIVIEVSGGSPKQPTGRSLYLTDNIIDRLGGITEPASFCRKFRPISKLVGLYAGLHLDIIYLQGKMWGYQNQSTGISNFQTKSFLEREFLVLPNQENILDYFYSKARPLIDKKTSNQQVHLEKLRDTLLPKLLSGQLRIPDAEKLVKDAL